MKSTPSSNPSIETAPRLEVDTKYGGVYAGSSLEFSAQVVDYFNGKARDARGVLPGEFMSFEPGEYYSVACPSIGLPREQHIQAYHQLWIRLDGDLELRLGEFPRLFSTHLRQAGIIRGTPTYIPKSRFPSDFFGKPHKLELFQGETSIFGPVERFFHTVTSGALFTQIEGGQGKVVVEVRGNLTALQKTGQTVFFTDPTFGEPTGAAQLNDDGTTTPLTYDLLGKDYVGDAMLFNEGVVMGIKPGEKRAMIELYLPNKGTGLAAALYSGHTQEGAFRTDVTIS